MKITFLGTGTSTGVPVVGCDCGVCHSTDPRNKRLRASVLVESGSTAILIDTSTDLRAQMLRTGFRELSGVVYTHFHADHIMGLDDLRPFNFRMRREINVYADESSASRIESIFHYAFNPDPDYQGGAPPKLVMNRIEAGTPFQVGELILKPLEIMHGKQSILGFRIGNFAYLTDCSGIPQVTQVELSGLELIAVSGLRHRPHPTHFTITQAVRAIEALDVKRGLLTHISHEIDHAEAEQFIRGLTTREIGLACDEMMVEL